MSTSHPIDAGGLLGASFDCECGARHQIGVREIVYADDAFARLPDLVNRHVAGRRLALVADRRTWSAAGEACAETLRIAGWSIQAVILADRAAGGPVCDEAALESLRGQLEPCDGMLAVGAGVVSDLVKWHCAGVGLPYVTFATAASMNGYTSSNIAPAIKGVKRVLQGTVPEAVVSAPTVLSKAPYELTAAGLGDVIAKPVSIADWKMNEILFGERFCSRCADMIREVEPGYLENPAGILAREPEAICALFAALLYSGLAMTMAGTSFPASGGEHLISHALDMTAMSRGIPHDLHGRQVGLGTVFACALYERVLALESPEFRVANEPTDCAYWGPIADVVEEEHALKREKAVRAVARLRESGMWDQLRATLAPMTRGAASVRGCLRKAGAASRIADIGCSRERFLDAALRCHQMRERYTILDLARAVAVMPGAAAEIVEEML